VPHGERDRPTSRGTVRSRRPPYSRHPRAGTPGASRDLGPRPAQGRRRARGSAGSQLRRRPRRGVGLPRPQRRREDDHDRDPRGLPGTHTGARLGRVPAPASVGLGRDHLCAGEGRAGRGSGRGYVRPVRHVGDGPTFDLPRVFWDTPLRRSCAARPVDLARRGSPPEARGRATRSPEVRCPPRGDDVTGESERGPGPVGLVLHHASRAIPAQKEWSSDGGDPSARSDQAIRIPVGRRQLELRRSRGQGRRLSRTQRGRKDHDAADVARIGDARRWPRADQRPAIRRPRGSAAPGGRCPGGCGLPPQPDGSGCVAHPGAGG
jgi:hypothetical protein